MRYASVCDGIGAVHVAWQPLGWHCEWTAEIDAFPAAVVEQRWGFPNRGDMTRFKEWDDAPIDLLVGGTPCQSFSVAGLRKGLHDPRGGLMLTFLEIAQRYRPRWVVWENVPGVLSSNGGRDFGAFLGALGELGYGWAYRVLDAQWFGVAQRRRRVFVVGCLGDERRAAQVLFESESVRRDNPPSRAKGQGATAAAPRCTGSGGERPYGFKQGANNSGCCGGLTVDCQPPLTGGQDHNMIAQPYRVANCLTQRMHKGINTTCDEGQTPVLAMSFDWQKGNDVKNPRPSTMNVKKEQSQTLSSSRVPAVAFTKSKRAQSNKDDETWVLGEVSPTMSCFDQGDTRATTVVAFSERTRECGSHLGLEQTDVCPAIKTGCNRQQGVLVPAVGTDLYNGAVDGDIAHAVRVGNGNVMGGVPSVMQAQAFTHSGYSNKPAWITGDRTDCLPSSGHGDTSHQGIGVMQPVGVDFQNCANTGDVSGTLMGEAQKKGGEAGHGVLTPMAVRRLTPRECERLQGFPDDYTAIEYRKKPAADGPRYKALGNSMAVPVMAWIGQRIQAAK